VVIKREPNLRILRFINEVLPVFRGSGSLPAYARPRQISIVSSSFLIAIICQINELLLDDFDLRVSHSRSGKPIKKVNRFHNSTVSDAHHKVRVCLQGVASY
jgi:hypothetical protein